MQGRTMTASSPKCQDSPVPVISVRFPAAVLAGLDRVAAEKGIRRNRLIVESCRRTVDSCRRTAEEAPLPDEFFTGDHLSAADLRLLRGGLRKFDEAIAGTRRSRAEPPF